MQIEQGWRLGTSEEIAAARAEGGAPHVPFGCTNCGMVNWTAKNLALGDSGSYTGARNIFVMDWSRGECACQSHHLRFVVRESA